jgi:6-phosphogluconolactonase
MMTARLLATGCYTDPGRGRGQGVQLLRLTPDGEAEVLTTASCQDPSFVLWSRSGDLLYVVQETAPTRVLALRVEPAADGADPGEDTTLRPVAEVALTGSGGCHVAYGAHPSTLVVAEYGSGHVETVRLDEAGLPVEVVDVEDHGAFAEGLVPHPHQSQVLPGTDLIAVTDLGLDRVLLYRQDVNGHLATAGEFPFPRGSGPRHLAADHESSEAYVACELSGQLAAIRRSPQEAATAPEWTVTSRVDASRHGGEDNAPSHIALTPDEQFVLIADRGPDTLAVFSRDHRIPELVAEHRVGAHPRHFTQCDDLVLVAAQEADRIDVLRREGSTLSVAAPPIASASVACVAIRP